MTTGRDSDFPIERYYRGEPIPNLSLIARTKWREAMTPLSQLARRIATSTAPAEGVSDALVLVGELELEDWAREARAREAAAAGWVPPHPTAKARAPSGGRQVNFRLGRGYSARLDEAAKLLAIKPTALARMLTINGVNRILHEDRRARLAAEGREDD